MPLPLAAAIIGGGLLSGLGSYLGSRGKGKYEQVSTLLPQQQEQLINLLTQLQGPQAQGLQNLQQLLSGSPEAFAKFEAPLQRQFQEETVPALAERFAGLGSHGGLSSSGFQQTAAQAGQRLSENLGSMRGQLQMQALNQLMGLMGQGQRPAFETTYQQPRQGFLGPALGGIGSGLASYGLMGAMGGVGSPGTGA